MNLENLSDAQIDVLSDVLRKLEKDRAGITKLELDVEDIINAKDSIFTADEIGEVMYKDITNSLFLNYSQKAEHEMIAANLRKNFGTRATEDLDGQYFMSRLYQKKNTKFSKTIDLFYITDPKDVSKVNDAFESFMEQVLDGVEYTYRADDGVLKTIKSKDILKKLDTERLRNRFTSIRAQDPEKVLSM